MSGSINTNTDASPDDHQGLGGASWLVPVILFLASPPAVLAALGTYALFSYMRIRRAVIAATLGLYLVLAAVFSWLLIPLLISAFTTTIPDIIKGEISPIAGILLFLVQQAPLTLPLGVVAGLIYSSYRWFTRPAWETREFRPAPWELWRRKKHIEEIQQDEGGPENGLTLGVTEYGKKIIQTDEEASAHTLVVGGSGRGKTTTLMSQARDAIRRGNGYIFVDLKADPAVADILHSYAERYNRKFYHWTMQSKTEPYKGPDPKGPASYDPISRGEPTRRKDLIISSWNWSEEFYKTVASDYLQMVFYILIGNPNLKVSTLSDVVALLDPKTLQERAIPLGKDPAYQEIVRGIDALNDTKIPPQHLSAIGSIRSQLSELLRSVAGNWLQVDRVNGHNIELARAAREGEVVVFSIDANSYDQLGPRIANLVIQDVKTLVSELMNDPISKPCRVVIDEFSAIGSENVVNLINKSRPANIPVTLSTQARGDLLRVDSTFADRIMSIINAFIIHGSGFEDDLEVYASLTGKINRKKFRQSVEHTSNFFGIGRGSGSGSGTVEDVEEYTIMPQEIKSLNRGELIYISNVPRRVEKVLVIPEPGKQTSAGSEGTMRAVTPVEAHQNLTVPTEHTGVEDLLPSLGEVIKQAEAAEENEPFLPGIERSRPAFPTGSGLGLDFNKGLRSNTSERSKPLPNPFFEQDAEEVTAPAATRSSFPSQVKQHSGFTFNNQPQTEQKPELPPTRVATPLAPQRAQQSTSKPSPAPTTPGKPTPVQTGEPARIKPATPKPNIKKDEFDF